MVYIIVILDDFASDKKNEKRDVTSKNARLVELETMTNYVFYTFINHW